MKEHEQAPPLPVDTVCAIEGLRSTAHTLPLRVFAGVICLCVHGVKRWADVQHAKRVVNTADGVMLTTYKSKKRDKPLLWAALRLGFLAEGAWADAFQENCLAAHLPRDDFLVLRPTTNLQSFTKFPAVWADANRCLHAILVLTGMRAEEAARYTMHSCRHVYPTCAYQLLFPPPAVTLMGHWAQKADQSAGVYDGARTATELAYKAIVCKNIRLGWRPVPQGNVTWLLRAPLAGLRLLRPCLPLRPLSLGGL